jgi:carbamoyltransferase
VEYCLTHAGLSAGDLDFVVFGGKPLRHFDRLLESWLSVAPRGYPAFRRALPEWLHRKLPMQRTLRRHLPEFRRRFAYVEHHVAHAASAYYPSPFDEAAILTVDAVGEWATTAIGTGRGAQLTMLEELRFPHSLGLLYSAVTAFLGFRVNSGEYKVMGLAPYGRPVYRDRIRQQLVHLQEDGSFRLNPRYFDFVAGRAMVTPRFAALFDGPPRVPESPLTERDRDLAASIQCVLEEAILNLAGRAVERTGMKRLVLAGGVALNCVANSRLLREGPFERVWIQPAAGDAGNALGAALWLWHRHSQTTRVADPGDSQQGSLLGPAFSDAQIREVLTRREVVFREVTAPARNEEVAAWLADGWIVGWFQGRMEFGPRALGGRSILADPRNPDMVERLNHCVKLRESFRPFAPCVLDDHAAEWFDLPRGLDSPYMLLTAQVRNAVAGQLPAVTHVDGTARVQTVGRSRFPELHGLLTSFEQRTGCPVLLNTSFNVRGEPLVCSPDDAVDGFLATGMDGLAIGNFLLERSQQPSSLQPQRERSFAPD